MTARRPAAAPLLGRSIRLDPFTAADAVQLWRPLGRPEVFAGGWGGGPAGLPASETAFVQWLPRYLPVGQGNPYVIRVAAGPYAGTVVGTTSLADFDECNETAHLGWTAYDPRVWGTQVNPEAKLLLLGLAFGSGFGRVKLQADVRNERSRAAIAALGAHFEGVTRRDKRRADGSWRDATIFSILRDEWPDVRARLEARLAAFPDAAVRIG